MPTWAIVWLVIVTILLALNLLEVIALIHSWYDLDKEQKRLWNRINEQRGSGPW